MKYALLLMALMATQAQAQIIYTDVIPDATYNVSGDTCHLDLDNNGQADFKLCQFDLPAYCDTCPLPDPELRVMVFTIATNVIADTAFWGWGSWPQCLHNGLVIDAGLSMSATNGILRDAHPGGGCMNGPFPVNCVPWPAFTWANFTEGYLGLRFDIAGATHHGWARLSIPNAGEFTLKDYAYNSVPDEAILAGEGAPTGITDLANSSVQVSPNPFTSTLSVSMGMNKAGVATCTVRALTGQALLTRTFATTSGPSSITLDLGSLAPGTYLLEMQVDGVRIVRKVLKE